MTTTTTTPYTPSAAKRAQVWLANHFAVLSAILVLLYLFLPVAYTFAFSFNDHGKTNIVWQGFTWEHWQDPCGVPGVCGSLVTSLQVGAISTIVATVLGTLMALAMVRYRFRGKAASNVLIFVPMATPEIVMGAALLTIFVQGFSNIGISLGAGPLRQPDADLLEGHLPADPARDRGCRDAGLLAVLRRLHHHQLRLRQREHVPQVRLCRLAPRHPRGGQRHRLLDVRACRPAGGRRSARELGPGVQDQGVTCHSPCGC
jgi:hypothetical protein